METGIPGCQAEAREYAWIERGFALGYPLTNSVRTPAEGTKKGDFGRDALAAERLASTATIEPKGKFGENTRS
jgi:hypothetical protein